MEPKSSCPKTHPPPNDLENRLELCLGPGRNGLFCVDSKARVRPALDEIAAVLVDLASLLEDLEERVAKGDLELAEDDLGILVELPSRSKTPVDTRA